MADRSDGHEQRGVDAVAEQALRQHRRELLDDPPRGVDPAMKV